MIDRELYLPESWTDDRERCAEVPSAIEQAKEAAGDKNVGLHGATVMQQGLPLGLVDEIHVHVVPLLIGSGTRLFDTLPAAIRLEQFGPTVTSRRRPTCGTASRADAA